MAAYLTVNTLMSLLFELAWSLFGEHLATPLIGLQWRYGRPFALFCASFIASLFPRGWLAVALLDVGIVVGELSVWFPGLG